MIKPFSDQLTKLNLFSNACLSGMHPTIRFVLVASTKVLPQKFQNPARKEGL
jgi:hypothetical protein